MSSRVEITDSGLLPDLSFFHGVEPNTYELKGGMVVYITGEKGAGKTQLMAHLAGTQMLPPIAYDKVCAAREEAANLRAKGYKYADIPSDVEHLVFSPENEIIRTSKDQGYLPRETYIVNYEKLKVPRDGDTDVQFAPWGATFTADEILSKWDSRNWNKADKALPEGFTTALQTCRQRDWCFLFVSLEAGDTDKRIRTMSNNILHIIRREDTYKNDEVCKTVWWVLEFRKVAHCDKFISSLDAKFATPRIFIHYGNMHECVDSYSKNDDFVKGLEDKPIEFRRREA